MFANYRGLDGYHPALEDEAYGISLSAEDEYRVYETNLLGAQEIADYLSDFEIPYLDVSDPMSDYE